MPPLNYAPAVPATTRKDTILQWNCRGLSQKVGELKERLRLGSLRAWALLLQEANGLPRIPFFTGYASPTIIDHRNAPPTPRGKAVVYVLTRLPQQAIDLQSWCSPWQETVAVKVQLSPCAVILVSCYVRPHSGHAPRARFGWISHIRAQHPGCPILIGGDFNAPHPAWGYNMASARGSDLLKIMENARFTLLNDTTQSTRRSTSTRMPPHSPDLAWWLGPTAVTWRREPDCWGSDHHPIYLDISSSPSRRLRRKCHIIKWDEFRKSIRQISAFKEDPLSSIQKALEDSTTVNWVDESRPNPDLRLLQLWAQRR